LALEFDDDDHLWNLLCTGAFVFCIHILFILDLFCKLQAGIEGRNLTLALEPEAASLFCRYSPTFQSNGQENTHVFDVFKPETKYMVVDLGGMFSIDLIRKI
jgi:hypothetical protein